ncbi:MAG: NADP-dependent oxidoreductase [Gammaproteobacteria bacterium]|nr:NADP-dependent oxidoreductase [Gammaproteobacteria bacterium]
MREDRNCQWRIAARPSGNVRPSDFAYEEHPVPEIGPGEFLLKTLYLGIRPVMRMYMQGVAVAGEKPLAIGDLIHGRGVAQVVRSNHPGFAEGDVIQGQIGWQTWKASHGTEAERIRKLDCTGLPYSLGAGVLGMNGFSAYTGFVHCGHPLSGDVAVVSAAAGGVGSTVIQIARILGCRVIGIAGGTDKCDLLLRLGCSAAIDYKNEDIDQRLTELCPEGIDVYFDNVGGDTLSICMEHLAMHARIALCGSISEYMLDEPFGLCNYTKLRMVNGTMSGFFVYNFEHLFDEATERLAEWIRNGELIPVEDIVDGFDNMPAALARLYAGDNVGVQVCRVRDEPGN